MIIVVIPVIILFAIILIKKIPVIGGNIQVALMLTGLAALLMGGMYNPVSWITAWIDGIDRLAWIFGLAVFGSIYAETQVRLGTMETVINSLRASFGRSPKGLIVCVVVALTIAGSLIGDATASSTVVGVLVISALAEMELSPEQIASTVVMGASLGSIMPPITQAVFLAATMANVDPDAVVKVAYFTVGLGVILCSIYAAFYYVKIKSLPEDLIPKEKASQILAKNWHTMVPLAVLLVLVVLRTGLKIDIATMIFGPFLSWLGGITIAKGIANLIVFNIIMATVVAFCFPSVRRDIGSLFTTAMKNVFPCVSVQLSAGLMLGAFYAAGQIEAVQKFAMGLNQHVLKIGGGFSLMAVGMLTGSQTTAQNTIFSFLAPALTSAGVDPVNAAVAGAHLAMSGQGMPPACLTTFVVCGLVGGILGKKVDPLRTMFYNMPMCIYFLTVGMIFLYI